MKPDTVILLGCILIAISGFILGEEHRQHQIENRALEMNKECYSGTDLGYIIQDIKQP
jgi:hypothetical protein